MLEVDVDVRKLVSDHHLQVADDSIDVGLGGGAAPVGGLGRKLDGDGAHGLLWFAVVLVKCALSSRAPGCGWYSPHPGLK